MKQPITELQKIVKVNCSTMQSNDHAFDHWVSKNKYYHERLINFYRAHISEGSSVLHIGCKDGYLLAALKPSHGVGVDEHGGSIDYAERMHPDLTFVCGTVQAVAAGQQFDHIILPFVTMQADDIQDLFTHLRPLCHERTRIIVETYSPAWAPILWTTKKLGWRRPTLFKHFLSSSDLKHLLYLAGFEVVIDGPRMLMPIHIPGLSWFCNSVIAHIPLINWLCLHRWMITRPTPIVHKPSQTTVSVIVTCKNEEGNVAAAVERCPDMGKDTELIFVEGGSRDNTYAEIERVMAAYPKKNIRLLKQQGKGKYNAVREGFAAATGDILMILDGDLTSPPEDLPKFFDALVSGKGEFVNGSRMVYPMESESMLFFIGPITNWCFSVLLSFIINQRIKDTLCGVKVLWKKDYERIGAQRHLFGDHDPFGDFDLLFGAAKLDLKIIDMPITYKRRTYGATNISHFRDFWTLLRVCWHAVRVLKL